MGFMIGLRKSRNEFSHPGLKSQTLISQLLTSRVRHGTHRQVALRPEPGSTSRFRSVVQLLDESVSSSGGGRIFRIREFTSVEEGQHHRC